MCVCACVCDESFTFSAWPQTLLLQVKQESERASDKLRADFAASTLGVAVAKALASKTAERVSSSLASAKTSATAMASTAFARATNTPTLKLLGKAATLMAPVVCHALCACTFPALDVS
jgi:hypothetical protein